VGTHLDGDVMAPGTEIVIGGAQILRVDLHIRLHLGYVAETRRDR